jgi:glycosyltransferase involved in cell wall biosynthesis
VVNQSISVVIPSSRDSKKLLKSVQSVLNQTLFPNEIIVVRNSHEVLDSHVLALFKRSGIVHMDIGKPIGVSSARNIGIQHAKSEYVAFLDDDDVWMKEKLEIQIDFMMREGLKACTTSYYFEHRGKKRVFPEQTPTSVIRDMALRCHCGPGSTLVISKELISSLGLFKSELGRYEDWYLMAQVTAGKHEYKHLDVITAVVNKTEASWASNPTELINLSNLLQEFDIATAKDLTNGIIFERAVNEKRNGNYFSALYALIEWIVKNPSNLRYLTNRVSFKITNHF